MSVRVKTLHIINHRDFLSYLIALILSTLLIGYAPSSIALGVFVFFALRYAIVNKVKLSFDVMMLLPIILYLLFCASYFWSVDQQLTLKGIGRLVSFLTVPLVFSIIPKLTMRSFRLIFNSFSISNVLLGGYFIIVATINYIKTGQLTVFTYHDLVQVLDLNAIYVAVFFSISFFFLISKTNKSQLDIFGLIFLGLMIFLLSSKMIIVTFIICNMIYIVFYKGIGFLKSTKAIAIISVALVISIVASKQVINRFLEETTTNFEEVLYKDKFNRVYPWTGTSIRLLQLRNLKAQIEEDDIFWKGFGLFASRENLKERHLAFNTYYGYHGYNYHNMYAQIFSELGIFGFLILLLILILGFAKANKSKSFLYFAFYVLMTMTFLTESFLWVQRGLFLFIIMHCILNRTVFSNLNKLNTFN
jgi:O-antigen ligase